MSFVEGEPGGGALEVVGAESEVEKVLGGVEKGTSGEEEWGREEGTNGFGDEGEARVVPPRDSS